MDLFDVLTLIGGLCLFLFGMNVMGEALESRAGNKLRTLLSKMTTGKFAGFLTGLGVTAIIQSGNNGYGSRVCKFRADEFKTGDSCHHGSQHWNDGNGMVVVTWWNQWR